MKDLTCPNCGHTKDVIIRYGHVGGHPGDMPYITCQNETECWRRWDEQQAKKKDKINIIDWVNMPSGDYFFLISTIMDNIKWRIRKNDK